MLLEKQTVVLYTTSAQCFIKLKNGNETGTTPIQYAINGQTTTTFTTFQVPVAGGVITNLPLNATISIFSLNSESIQQKIGEISTHRYDQDVIPLDMNLYYPITNWIQEGQNATGDLYTVVAGLTDAHFLEKSYFVQQFFYGGYPLLDTEIGDVPDRPVSVPESGCLCRPLQLSVAETITPSGGDSWFDPENGNYLPDFSPGGDNIQYFGNNDRGKRWYSYSYDGPAKYQQVWIETRKCEGGNNKMQMDNLSSNGPGSAAGPSAGNVAMLSYTFTCVGIDDFRPEYCPCERERKAQVCWKYAAQAQVFADLRSGWCFNGRGAVGGAMDVATVMWGYSDQGPSDMPLPIAANQILVGAGCDMNFDEASLAVNLFKTALYGIKTIKNLGLETPNGIDQIFGLVYGTLAANAIKDLFSDDYVETNGSCGTNINPGGILVNGCERFDLKVNRRLVVTLISNSKLVVEGHGKYEANARILSSYALSGTIMRSDPDQSGVNCCSNGHGVYSLASYNPGMNLADAQGFVRSNFIGAGLNNIPGLNLNITGEFGYRGGGASPDCNLVIVSERESDAQAQLLPKSAPKMYTLGNEVWLRSQAEVQDWQFTVLDANGQVSHQRNGAGSDIQLFNFNQASIPSGIYFLQFRDSKGLETLKVIKSQ